MTTPAPGELGRSAMGPPGTAEPTLTTTVTSAAPALGQPEPPAVPAPVGLVDAIAVAVRAVPGVADLHTGAFGEVATYLPGRRVGGIRLLPGRCEVHVVIRWGSPVLATAAAIRAAAAASVTGPVDVTIEDVVVPAASANPAPANPAQSGPGVAGSRVHDPAGSSPRDPSSVKETL